MSPHSYSKHISQQNPLIETLNTKCFSFSISTIDFCSWLFLFFTSVAYIKRTHTHSAYSASILVREFHKFVMVAKKKHAYFGQVAKIDHSLTGHWRKVKILEKLSLKIELYPISCVFINIFFLFTHCKARFENLINKNIFDCSLMNKLFIIFVFSSSSSGTFVLAKYFFLKWSFSMFFLSSPLLSFCFSLSLSPFRSLPSSGNFSHHFPIMNPFSQLKNICHAIFMHLFPSNHSISIVWNFHRSAKCKELKKTSILIENVLSNYIIYT